MNCLIRLKQDDEYIIATNDNVVNCELPTSVNYWSSRLEQKHGFYCYRSYRHIIWCPRRDSNPHVFRQRILKSRLLRHLLPKKVTQSGSFSGTQPVLNIFNIALPLPCATPYLVIKYVNPWPYLEKSQPLAKYSE